MRSRSEQEKEFVGADATAVESAGSIVSDAASHVAPHTPGPWMVATDVYGRLDISVFAKKVRYDSRVAMINGKESRDDIAPPREVALANAHLIAAAPEMLEALKNLLGEAAPFVGYAAAGNRLNAARDRAATVILKAEGRSVGSHGTSGAMEPASSTPSEAPKS